MQQTQGRADRFVLAIGAVLAIAVIALVLLAIAVFQLRTEVTELTARVDSLEQRRDVAELRARLESLEDRPGIAGGLTAQEVADLIRARVMPIENRMEALAEIAEGQGVRGQAGGLAERLCSYVTERFTQAEWLATDYNRAEDLLWIAVPETQLYFSYGFDSRDVYNWIGRYCWE